MACKCKSCKGCCRKRLSLELRRKSLNRSNGEQLYPKVINNSCYENTNQFRWHFYKIGAKGKRIPLASTPYALNTNALGIGQNSIYKAINLSDGYADLFDYLSNAPVNAPILATDTIVVKVELKNCEGQEVCSNYEIFEPTPIVVTDKWVKWQGLRTGDGSIAYIDGALIFDDLNIAPYALSNDANVNNLSVLAFDRNGLLMVKDEGANWGLNSNIGNSFVLFEPDITFDFVGNYEVFFLENQNTNKRLLFRTNTPTIAAGGNQVTVTLPNVPYDVEQHTWITVDGRKLVVGKGLLSIASTATTITYNLETGYEVIGKSVEIFGRIPILYNNAPTIISPNSFSITASQIPNDFSNLFLMINGRKMFEAYNDGTTIVENAIKSISANANTIVFELNTGYEISSSDSIEVIFYEP